MALAAICGADELAGKPDTAAVGIARAALTGVNGRQLRPQVFVAAGSGRDLPSPTDRKPEQRAADDQHDDHNQNELTDTGEKTSGLKLGGEQAGLGRSDDHGYQW